MAAETLGRVLTDNALRFPDGCAYRLGPHAVTHRELYGRAVQLVVALARIGVRRGDRVAVLGRNSIEFGVLLAATQLSGVILAPLSFRMSAPEVLDALRRVTPKVVFCDDEFLPTVADLIAHLPEPPAPVALGDSSFTSAVTSESLPFAARPGDIACLLFTSGTTGSAKCCVIGQRELWQVAHTMNAEMRTGSQDRVLINMPMFHIGAIAIIGGLHARGGTVLLQKQFDEVEAAELIGAGQVTVLHLAPVMLQRLLEELDEAISVDRIQTVVYSAAPMTEALLRRAVSALPRAGFLNLYGQTEAIVSGLPRAFHRTDGAGGANILGSVGFPFPGVRVRIVDDGGHDVEPGQTGEIVVSSEFLFRGYWDDAAATLATLRDGWCHTGDIGRFDERGLLYLVDRKKDVIISGGENVFSPEVEDAIGGLDVVIDCAVVGAPDERWGETVCAVVVLQAEASLTLQEVQQHVRPVLAGYKVPRRLMIVDELPLLASGKVDKKRLRAIVHEVTQSHRRPLP